MHFRAFVLMVAVSSSPVAAAAPGGPEAAKAVPKPHDVKGRLHAFEDGALIVGSVVPADRLAHMTRSKVFRVARSAAEITDHTIFQGRVYLAYAMAPKSIPGDSIARSVGRDVVLELARMPDGRVLVVGLRREGG